MSLRQRLSDDLKAAMKSGDAQRKTVIRGALAAMNETEQRKREDLVKQALKKHGVQRPTASDEAAAAAYEQAVQAALAAEKVEEQAALDEGEALAVIQRLVKQRQDSIAEAERGGRADIAQSEGAELTILQDYLPRQMTREEIEAEVRAQIAASGASDMRDMGKVMGPLMQKLQGQVDGKVLSEVVRELLAG